MEKEAVEEEAQVQKKKLKTKTMCKKKPLVKRITNRPVSPELVVQVETTLPQPTIPQPQPQTSQQSTQTTNPYANNIEDIIKPEPMKFDFDINSLEFSKFRISLERKKTRRTRKPPARLIQILEVPQIAKEPSKKDTEIYVVDIEEFSDVNLFLDELSEVRCMGPSARLPGRLVFTYKGRNEPCTKF